MAKNMSKVTLSKQIAYSGRNAVDTFTGEAMQCTEGKFHDNPAMVLSFTEDDRAEFYSKLVQICKSTDEKQFILPLHGIKKHTGIYYLAGELPIGTLKGYLSSRANHLFTKRDDGTFDMTDLLICFLERILRALFFLDKKFLSVSSLKLDEIYVCGNAQNVTIKLLHSITDKANMGAGHRAFKNLIEDIFALNPEYKNPSLDVVHLCATLKDGKFGEEWTRLHKHPACMSYWKKRELIYEAANSGVTWVMNRSRLSWPRDPIFHTLANHSYQNASGDIGQWAQYDTDKFYSFVYLVRNKLQHYGHGDSIPADILAKYPNEEKFVRHVERVCPELWIVLADTVASKNEDETWDYYPPSSISSLR